MKRLVRIVKIGLAVVAGVLVAGQIAAPWWMRRDTARYTFSDIGSVPARPVGIVFGALVYPDGTMSDALVDRVQAGASLYKAGKVKKLLLTGNDSGPSYDEIGPMRALALKLGVPESALLIDGKGYRTYDSCYRAVRVYHIRSAILVTQGFHLPRALYLARWMGMDAVGCPAAPARLPLTRAVDDLRERFATLFAFADTCVRRRPGLPAP